MDATQYLVDSVTRRELTHALKRADPAFFEDALRFLEDDPRTFGSGYIKERIWHYITRYPLDSTHLKRLEAAAIRYLFRPMAREFQQMCLTMSRVATPAFWDNVSQYAGSNQFPADVNARCLLPYAEGIVTGEQARMKKQLEQKRLRWSKERKRLQRAECWPGGVIRYKDPDPKDVPIFWYTNELDEFLTAIEWRACQHDIVLPELEAVLITTGLTQVGGDLTGGWVNLQDELCQTVGLLPVFGRDTDELHVDVFCRPQTRVQP